MVTLAAHLMVFTILHGIATASADIQYNLTVVSTGSQSIKFNWTDTVKVQAYKISAVPVNGVGKQVSGVHSHQRNNEITHEDEFWPLTPYTNYTLTVEPLGDYPTAIPKQTVIAATEQYTPGKVKMTVAVEQPFYIGVQWLEPEVTNGVIEEYNMVVVEVDVIVYNTTVNSSVQYLVIDEGIRPHTTYSVYVRARTAYDWGKFEHAFATTLPYKPTATPEYFNYTGLTSHSVQLHWGEVPQDQQNGDIEGYRLSYYKEKERQTVYTKKRDYIIDTLTPYTDYTFQLDAYVNISGVFNHGPEASLQLKSEHYSHQTVAISDEQRKKWLIEEKTTSSQLTFHLPSNISDLFDPIDGQIAQYQIFVVGSESNQEFRQSGTDQFPVQPLTWTQAKIEKFLKPYALDSPQASPPDWLDYSEHKRSVQTDVVTLGVQTCDNVKSYCNGPLRANRHYCAYIRGWTKGGFYRDSDCIVVEQTAVNWTPTIVGVSAALSCLLVAAIAVVVFYRYKRRPKRHVRMISPKCNVTLPSIPDQQTADDAYERIASDGTTYSHIYESTSSTSVELTTESGQQSDDGYILDALTVE